MSYFPNISSINTNKYTLFAEERQSEALHFVAVACYFMSQQMCNRYATDKLRINLILQFVTCTSPYSKQFV